MKIFREGMGNIHQMKNAIVEADLKAIDINWIRISNWSVSMDISCGARSKFIPIFGASLAIITVTGMLLTSSTQPTTLKNSAEKPFVKFMGDSKTHRYRASDAFFIPTEHGAKYQVKKPSLGAAGGRKRNSIFSELDKIRIFNAFVKYFSESEYWVVSGLNLRLDGLQKNEERTFIRIADQDFRVNFEPKDWYASDTQFLFKDEYAGPQKGKMDTN
jgi:hypothetical protein